MLNSLRHGAEILVLTGFHGLQLIVTDMKSVRALKMRLVAPMTEQIGTPTMHFCEGSRGEMHCWGANLNLFWHRCNQSQFLGPYITDYQIHMEKGTAHNSTQIMYSSKF